jgi:hypothetical protein
MTKTRQIAQRVKKEILMIVEDGDRPDPDRREPWISPQLIRMSARDDLTVGQASLLDGLGDSDS